MNGVTRILNAREGNWSPRQNPDHLGDARPLWEALARERSAGKVESRDGSGSSASNTAVRNALVEKYLPLVGYHAGRMHGRLPESIDVDDLAAAGVFGLLDAIEAFDVARDIKFETYCVPRIRGAMLDWLRDQDWVPRLVRAKSAKLKAAIAELDVRLGREPTVEELAAHMSLTVPALEKELRESADVHTVSLHKKWYETDSLKDVSEIDVLEDKRAVDPRERLERLDTLRLVTRGLRKDERLIVILYYYEEVTMKEIGATLNLSESRVSQMHTRLLEFMGARRAALAA